MGFVLVFLALQSLAQAPQKFNYQTVVRDNIGNILAGQSLILRLTIHDLTPTGAILYQELQPTNVR